MSNSLVKEPADRFDPFSDEGDEIGNLARFQPKAKPQVKPIPKKDEIKEVAEQRGYARSTSQKSKPARKKAKSRDTYRTGRSQQFNLRCKKGDIERFYQIADQQGWVNGQTLEFAIDALEQFLKEPDSPFWRERHIIPR